MGGTALITLVVFSIVHNKERNKYESGNNLSKAVNCNAHIDYLCHNKLEKVYAIYRDYRHGGLGPLVRNGILSVAEGNQLREIFAKGAQHFKTMGEYERMMPSAIKERPETLPDDYQDALEEIEDLTQQWQRMQDVLKKRFQSPPDFVPLSPTYLDDDVEEVVYGQPVYGPDGQWMYGQ